MRNTSRNAVAARRSGRLSTGEIVLIALVLVALLAAVLISGRAAEVKVGTSSIVVSAGESLWTIAEAHPVEGLSTGQNVQLLIRLNELTGSTIPEGATLQVPSSASSGGDLVAMK